MASRHNLFDHFTGDAGAVDDYYEDRRLLHKTTTTPGTAATEKERWAIPCPDCGSEVHSGWCLNEDCPSYTTRIQQAQVM